MKQIWGQKTCGKQLKQHKKNSQPNEMQDFNGRKLKSNQEKAEKFAKNFCKKDQREAVLEVKVKENKIYNGKQNIFQSHEENWLKKNWSKKL